jgi:hypothetical protein
VGEVLTSIVIVRRTLLKSAAHDGELISAIFSQIQVKPLSLNDLAAEVSGLAGAIHLSVTGVVLAFRMGTSTIPDYLAAFFAFFSSRFSIRDLVGFFFSSFFVS